MAREKIIRDILRKLDQSITHWRALEEKGMKNKYLNDIDRGRFSAEALTAFKLGLLADAAAKGEAL